VILKNDKKDVKKIMTTRGKLAITRTVLRPAEKTGLERLISGEGVKCVVPLDIALGIDDLPFKMTREMMCEVAFWAQNQCSFKAAESVLKKIYGTGVVAETIRKVTECVGGLVFKKDTMDANCLVDNMMNMELPQDKEGVLYLQIDGAALNTRCKDEEGSTWRENKLGMVFSSDNIRTHMNARGEKVSRIVEKEYTSYVGSVNEFKKYLFASAVRQGYGRYKQTVVLCDGAAWIRNMCEELFPDATQILDLFHLYENTYEYAKVVFHNDETKYKPWAEDVMVKFKTGKKEEALEQIEKLFNGKLPKGTVNLPTYVRNNMDRIDYARYAGQGYYVGSGAIESGNKVVLQKRLKLAGMRWNESTAQCLLSLRAKFESGLWSSCVVNEVLNHSFSSATKNL